MHSSTVHVSEYESPSEVDAVLRLINSVEAANRLVHWSIKEGQDGARLQQFDVALEKAWSRLLQKDLSTDSARIMRSDFLLKQLFELTDKSLHACHLVRAISADSRANCLGPVDGEHLLYTCALRK